MLLGLDHGSNTAWESPTTVAFLCISVILLTTFFFIELKVAAEPFVPRFVFFDRALLACFFCNFFAYSCWLAIGYDLPLYWQAVEGLSTTQAALRLLPGMGAGVISSLVAGWVSNTAALPISNSPLNNSVDHAENWKIFLAHSHCLCRFHTRRHTYHTLHRLSDKVSLGYMGRVGMLWLRPQHRSHKHHCSS